ncbi:MAG: disulfide bond formation protein B [Alphaproteobacteria bacterium]|nr:disulfide bond formation protein B [Alphaproteobacteria bacterium]
MNALPLDRIRWPAVALLASAAMLATAHAFERFLYLAPCPLCYNQRQIFWAAGAIALVAVLAAWRAAPQRVLYALNVLLGIVFLAGAGIAAYHALVEWGVLPAPPTCATGAVELGGDLWSQLGERQAVPSCAEAKWRLLGLSMAGWNVLVSVALACLSLVAAFRPVRADTANETSQLNNKDISETGLA